MQYLYSNHGNGFQRISEDAARRRAEALGILRYPARPRFEHFNVYEDHVTIIDNQAPKGQQWVDIWFRGDRPFCEYCQESDCEHIRFALELPEVIQALKKHGWTVKDGKIVRR